MATRLPPGESLRELVARLIDQGKAYLHAEVSLAKRTALSWVSAAKLGLAFAIGALFVAQAALTTSLVALGFTLALWVGTAGGMAIAALVGLVVAGVLGWLAASHFAEGGK